ncbi:MAG: hypothetical protein JWN04_335 [Myxococcaceae bacterium]|nr:hypothetical protein [Myxococcaceae bacterium]
MLQLKNQTMFKGALATFPNAKGIDTIYVVITATFDLWPRLAVSEQQLGPVLSDEYYDDSGASSMRYAGELHLGKPTTDVIVVGHARALEGKPVPELGVGVRVAERKKVARVFGDRHWSGVHVTRPAPFSEMPLVYERAFGGVLELKGGQSIAEERNPLGKGLSLSRRCPALGDAMPNIEDARLTLSEGARPDPVGFGCISPAWLPRRTFAGTFDEAWQRTRAPYLPDDFQARYFSCASEGLVFDRYLQGGEPVTLMGMSQRGTVSTVIPTLKLDTTFVLAGTKHPRPNHLQTVLIEPDDNRMRLTFHTEFPCDKKVLQVDAAEISIQSLDLGPGSPQ